MTKLPYVLASLALLTVLVPDASASPGAFCVEEPVTGKTCVVQPAERPQGTDVCVRDGRVIVGHCYT